LNNFGSNCLGDRSDLADEVGLAMAVLEAEDKTGSARAQNARPAIRAIAAADKVVEARAE
jgi:hypothetical protein